MNQLKWGQVTSQTPLEAAMWDPDLKDIMPPPKGEEFPRVPSPPSSLNWDAEMDDDTENNKKERKSQKECVTERNEKVMAYLMDLKEHPPKSYEHILAESKRTQKILRRRGTDTEEEPEILTSGNENVCYSETTRSARCSFVRNNARALDYVEEQYRQKMDSERGIKENYVHFSHTNFQRILEAQWQIIRIRRMEQIYDGNLLDGADSLTWTPSPDDDMQKIYGPMDPESEEFQSLNTAFQEQRQEAIAVMIEEETKIILHLKEKKMNHEADLPDYLAEKLNNLRIARANLEEAINETPELQTDQNPYTNPDCMDFWVMPRPKETIDVYTLRKKDMDNFVEFNVSRDDKGLVVVDKETAENEKAFINPFIREGINAAVYDVGWNFAQRKIYGDISWKGYFLHESDGDSKKWRELLLRVRKALMAYHPFGVDSSFFVDKFRRKYLIRDIESIFGRLVDSVAIGYLGDLFFSQKLGDKIILFDSLLEGVISTPEEMLLRFWMQIRRLIEESPNHCIPIPRLAKIYEDHFAQRFFPLHWGFTDAEDVVYKLLELLPENVTKDMVVVKRDPNDLKKMTKVIEDQQQKDEQVNEIDAQWAKIFEKQENRVDERHGIEDKEWTKRMEFYDSLLTDEWPEECDLEDVELPEGAVLRILDF